MRWVETNKGDDQTPSIRSRLVAREIRTAGQDSIFAPTPPLESLRMILTMATTDFGDGWKVCRDPDSEQRTQILMVDISRAYFNAKSGQGWRTARAHGQTWEHRGAMYCHDSAACSPSSTPSQGDCSHGT